MKEFLIGFVTVVAVIWAFLSASALASLYRKPYDEEDRH